MNIKLLIQGLALTTVLVSSHLASAEVFNLCTGVTTKTMPDGNTITMWGYAHNDSSPTCVNASSPGPLLTVPDGDTVLTINLRNTLAVPTSIIIPGLSSPTPPAPVFFTPVGDIRPRARAMTHETPDSGGLATYTFNATPGTYLYQSGSHPAVQVQMGLYGAITNDASAGQVYTGIAYDNEVVMLYSEIDPALHIAVAGDDSVNPPILPTYGTLAYQSTINYVPKYFLVNGAPYTSSTSDIVAGTTGQTTLLRFLNAGLESHIPVLQGGHMDVIAEYGSPYPYQRKQSSLLLAAGQSKDALFTADTAGRYALYDRRLRLTNNMQAEGGLMSFLEVTAAAGTPVAVIDSGATDEDTVNTAINLAGNDSDDVSINLDSIYIPFQPANGTVVANNNGTGTVTYTPNANFNGADTFSYVINDNLGNTSAPAEVTITVNPVNDAPVATDETYAMDAIVNPTISIAAPGVLSNDTDIELSTLTAVIQTDVTGGTLVLNSNGSFDYTPNIETIVDSFTYAANDGSSNSNTATVTINIDSLTAATLVSPSGTLPSNINQTYIWDGVSIANEYKLIVVDTVANLRVVDQIYTATDAGCATGTSCSITSSTSLPDGAYRWRIRTKNTEGWGPWSSIMKFTVGSTPVATTLIAPSGANNVSMPTFSWNAIPSSTDYKLLVTDIATSVRTVEQIYTATDTGCATGTGACSIIPSTPLPPAAYRWRIRTKNATGWGPWSSAMNFSVGALPVAATLNTPANNSFVNTATPNFNWNAVAVSTEYKLLVFDRVADIRIIDEAFTAGDAGCATGATCSITSSTPLADGLYRWRIRAKNSTGWGPWSDSNNFTVVIPQ